MADLTHLGADGAAHMVDVSAKADTAREAVAEGRITMSAEALEAVRAGNIKKGDVLGTARIAGIMAAKKTSELIPLCHPLMIGGVYVNFRIEDDYIEIETQVETVDRTGVEMEALTACSVAALTIYDMCKSSDRSMTIGEIALWEKTGGRSGTYRRDPDASLGEEVLDGSFTGSTESGEISEV
mgnify:FL=1